MKLLTKEQQESHENAKICCICKEKFENKYVKDRKYSKVRDHCHYTMEYRGVANSICNLKYSVPKNFFIAFHNKGCVRGLNFAALGQKNSKTCTLWLQKS